jgi:hypothetical protein
MMMHLILVIAFLLCMAAPGRAAVSCSLLTSGQDTTDRTSAGNPYVTASISPGANKLILFAILVNRGTASDTASVTLTPTGNSLTYTLIDQQNFSLAGNPGDKLALFRAMGSSPTSGAISIEWSPGHFMSGAAWAVVECSGVNTSGTHGSGAVVQSDKDEQNPGTGLTLSLAAFEKASNATFATFANDSTTAATVAMTPEGGWTELAEQNCTCGASQNYSINAQWIASNDTTPSATWSSVDAAGIAIEIKAVPTARAGAMVMP